MGILFKHLLERIDIRQTFIGAMYHKTPEIAELAKNCSHKEFVQLIFN